MKLLLLVTILAISHVAFSQEEEVGEWMPVKLTDLNTDSNLRDILNLGVQDVIAKGIQDEELPNTNYYIEDVLSIASQVVAGTNYEFKVVIADDEGNEFTIKFTVFEDLTGVKTVEPSYEVVQTQGEGAPFGGWKSIDTSEVDTDPKLNYILNRFSSEVVSIAVDHNQLSSITYQPTEIYSIKEQLVSGTNYRFNLKLENYDGGYAHVIFVVYDEWTNPLDPMSLTSILFLDIQNIQEEESQSN